MAAGVKINALLFGNIVLAVVILGCIVSCVFHGCCKVYQDTLNTIRAIVNSIILTCIYILQLIASISYKSFSIGNTLVSIAVILLFTKLLFNVIVMIILHRR